MIRFIYWFLVLIEVSLLLGVLVLFIITDARTIKYVAESSLDASGLSYESIEGNIFDGLEIKKLYYEDKLLFRSALIHWNPLTLFSNKVTITQLNAQGLELDNIVAMLNVIKSKSSKRTEDFDFDFLLTNAHLDINPYIYEGVKFSSFIFETGKIEIAKNLTVNANMFYLKFDSNIVNAKMYATIKDSALLIDKLELKNISVEEITALSDRLETKSKEEHSQIVSFPDIKIKHILGTMKAVEYGDLKIRGAILNVYDGIIEPSHNFRYQAKKVDFKGETNFGKLEYRGYIKDANIYAKGKIKLEKELFKKYALPLNFKDLTELPSSLHLNDKAVWIDIEHKVQKLFKIKNDFNVDVSRAKHKLHYNYKTDVFSVDSDIEAKMTYANFFKLTNKIIIDEEGFSYSGQTLVQKPTSLPPVISDYLLPSLEGKFKGDSHKFEMALNSDFFNGFLKIKDYKNANIEFKSKKNNIELKRIITNIPNVLEKELVGLEGIGIFDFRDFQKSRVSLNVLSNTMDIEAEMKLTKPYSIEFITKIKNDSLLNNFDSKINFSELESMKGTLELLSNRYLFRVWNEQVKLFIDYDFLRESINKGVFQIDNQAFSFQKNYKNELVLNSRIMDIKKLLKKIKRYYKIDLPNIEGSIDLIIKEELNQKISIVLKSPHLKYVTANKTINIYNIESEITLNKKGNVFIENYKFRLDDNGYLNVFYSNNKSFLTIKDGELDIKNFWLNDKVLIRGKYEFKSSKGKFNIDAKKFRLNNKDFDLFLKLNLDLIIDREQLDVSGDVDLLSGTIRYEIIGQDIVEDTDIIIMEEIVKSEKLPFENLKLYIKIKSKEALKYIAEDVRIEFVNQLSIVKSFNHDMLVTGTSTIKKGYYQLEDKRFILDESHLYFTGDIKKPLLDIKANYEKEQYNVHIFISGTTDAPIVNFNSDPYLTQQEILSLILFDGTGSSSGKGAEAYTLLGGSFAKGLIKSLGVDVDHLSLGKDRYEQLSLEVGRKVSKDVSVLYLHRDGLDGVKVRIEHSKSFETDIIIQPPNTSSIEFLYKQDR